MIEVYQNPFSGYYFLFDLEKELTSFGFETLFNLYESKHNIKMDLIEIDRKGIYRKDKKSDLKEMKLLFTCTYYTLKDELIKLHPEYFV